MAHANVVSLTYGTQLYPQDGAIDSVYFPLNCVISILVGVSDSTKVEMATVGKEGMVGFPIILDVRRALGDNMVQVPGDAVRVDANILRNESKAQLAVRRLMLRYLDALMRQLVYAGSCNR